MQILLASLIVVGIFALYGLNLSGTYFVNINSQKKMFFEYYNPISKGNSPACGCMKRLDENRGVSFPTSSLNINSLSVFESPNIKRHLVIQSGSLLSDYMPSLSFSLKVFNGKNFDNSLIKNSNFSSFMNNNKVLYKDDNIFQLFLSDVSNTSIVPDDSFPYIGYLPAEDEKVELSFLGNNNHIRIKHELTKIDVNSNIPNIGAPYIHPRVEVIGKKIIIFVDDISSLKNSHGLPLSKRIKGIIRTKKRLNKSSPFILVIEPQFSLQMHIVDTSGIKDNNGKILGWNPKLELVNFIDKPNNDIISINLIRYSRAKSSVILDFDLLNDDKKYQKMLSVAGENIESSSNKHISLGDLSVTYRYPDIPSEPKVSVWGQLKGVSFLSSVGEISSNFHNQKFVSNNISGLKVASDTSLKGYKSIDISADGSSKVTFENSKIEINSTAIGKASYRLSSLHELLAFLAIIIGLVGSILILIKKLDKKS